MSWDNDEIERLRIEGTGPCLSCARLRAEIERLQANTIALHKLLDKWSNENERLRALLKVLLDWPLTEEVRERVKQELGEQAKG